MANIKKPFFVCFLVFLLAWSVLSSGQEPRSVGVLVDSPAGRVPKTETSTFCEIVERLDHSTDAWRCEIRTADALGPLDSFETLLIYQGDEFIETTPLFSEETLKTLKNWLDGDPNRGIVLVGGAAALFDKLGFGPTTRNAVTSDNDREQSGSIPVHPAAAIFAGTVLDRETVWFTNAVYPVYDHFRSDSSDVVAMAEATTGVSNPLLAALAPREANSSDQRVKIFAFPWSISPLYGMAADGFRHNFETLLTNLILAAGRPLALSDRTAPLRLPDFAALHRALDDFVEEPESYPDGERFKSELAVLEKRAETLADPAADPAAAETLAADFADLQKRALLANPAIDFDEILFIRRDAENLGFPTNYNSNSTLAPTGYKNRVERLNIRTGERAVVFEPPADEFVGDLDLHFDADRFLFSMPDKKNGGRWRIWEYALTGGDDEQNPTLIQLIDDGDVDNYDACYLGDGRLIFCSTACFTGVPCIDGTGHVCNLYLRERDASVRQLTVEQDHDWSPTVMNNGRVMYQRWEYTDLPHCFSRIMFHMNPDGTNQAELYGSGSYWPEAMFYARPIPNDPTRFVAIVTGHHEQRRIGDLVLFDPGVARREADGAVQRIPGWGKKVEPAICDLPIGQTWPKFTHPFPIDGKTFLVSCKRSPEAGWSLCLVDLFDNIVTLESEEKFALLEPVPLRKTARPPTIPDRVRKGQGTADVFIADVYAGRGLAGVERGTIKSIRVISYQFAYQGMGAEPWSVGLDGPWDPKRVLGTVPVYEDGSAAFTVPAMTPIAFQSLDAEGKAVQLMRSWLTAMPGESVSCLGCHEEQNETGATTARTIASQSLPVEMEPFYGPARGFSFDREIQPILDRYCLECHTADSPKTAEIFKNRGIDPNAPDAPFVPDFRTGERRPLQENHFSINTDALFSPSYYQLRRFVRTPTKESQMPTLRPFEFHADSTRLVQLLQSGHYDAALDVASWDRLITWIDLNAPYHGNWGDIRNAEIPDSVRHQFERRRALRELYAGTLPLDDDPTAPPKAEPSDSAPDNLRNRRWTDADSPLSPEAKFTEPVRETVTVDGLSFDLITIPGTDFSFAASEVTNELFRLFNAKHDSGIEYGDFINFSPGELGYALNRDRQPAVRVTWNEANDFCRWLSEKTGQTFTLPTAEEWEYAARTSEKTLANFMGGDYSTSENLGDLSYARINTFSWPDRANVLPMWRPADVKIDDRSRVSAPAASYAPNAWGLFDMLGNVSEWTATDSVGQDGSVKKVVVGGSWATPLRRVSERRRFDPQVNVYDVGFRVVRRMNP